MQGKAVYLSYSTASARAKPPRVKRYLLMNRDQVFSLKKGDYIRVHRRGRALRVCVSSLKYYPERPERVTVRWKSDLGYGIEKVDFSTGRNTILIEDKPPYEIIGPTREKVADIPGE